MYAISSGITPKEKTKKLEGVNIEDDSMIQRSPFYIIVGPPSSGKSSLIEELLSNEKLYFKKFNKVIFITPSSFEAIDLCLNINWYPSIKLSWIFEKLEEQNKADEKGIKQVLLILDDCVSELKKLEGNAELSRLFYNRRHLFENVHVSIILTSQYWTKIPQSIRAMHTGLFLFKCPKTEWMKIKNEITLESIGNLHGAIGGLWKKPFSFVYINCLNDNVFQNLTKKLLI